MGIKERVVNMVRSFLNIEEAQPLVFDIQKTLDEQSVTYKNMIWFRGEPYELSQFYKQVSEYGDTFWGAVQTEGNEIRKIHTGLPNVIVSVIKDIIMTDYNGIDFDTDDLGIKDLWDEIEKDNHFRDLIDKMLEEELSKGKGAFKISFDDKITKYPIIEYFGKEKIEIKKRRGRIVEVIFKSYVKENKKYYLFKEHYGYGYIKYELFDKDGNVEYDLNTIEETKDLVDLEFDKSFMMAIPVGINERAIYDKKTHNFDALDEAWSQWMNALRDGRSKTYIPASLIPKDKKTGQLLRPNSFDNKYIAVEDSLGENSKNEIVVKQPNIPTDSYMNTYITALDLCLEGIISPATLGIDTKKVTDPNATAQREKEKTTLWTRGKIVDVLSDKLPKLVEVTFKAYQTQLKKPLEDITSTANFGEYANPSFEAQVETVGKGKTQGIMSIEASVDELYGDSKDDEWKQEEVKRLKNEQGIVDDVEIPAINVPVKDIETGIDLKKEGVVDENKE